VILLVNGVGYQVIVPQRLELPKGTEATLFIHTHVREDTLALYGFSAKNELDFFELLITVSGIGPKMAMEILNEPIEWAQNALFTGNHAALTRISGVGKKLAERMVLELKGKVEPAESSGPISKFPTASTVDEDAIAALESLGYKRNHIQRVLGDVPESSKTSEEIIRYFLQQV